MNLYIYIFFKKFILDFLETDLIVMTVQDNMKSKLKQTFFWFSYHYSILNIISEYLVKKSYSHQI